jgi:hypothetical protein
MAVRIVEATDINNSIVILFPFKKTTMVIVMAT